MLATMLSVPGLLRAEESPDVVVRTYPFRLDRHTTLNVVATFVDDNTGSWRYKKVEIKDGTRLRQTLDLANDSYLDRDIIAPRPIGDEGTEWPLIEALDINFDGYADLHLRGSCGSKPYMCAGGYWIYNPRSNEFVYSPAYSEYAVGKVTLDPAKRQFELYEYSGCAGECYELKTIAVGKNGEPRLERVEVSEVSEEWKKDWEHFEELRRSTGKEADDLPNCDQPVESLVVDWDVKDGKWTEVSRQIVVGR